MIVVAAVLTYSVAAFAGLWVAPQALWVSTPRAYALFQGGSLFGIHLFTVGWTLWSAGCVAIVLLRVMTSDAWHRVGRHRFVSLVGSVLMVVGLVGFGSFVLLLEVSLAAEHVLSRPYQDTAAFGPSAVLWVVSCCSIALALGIGAAGSVVDRMIGKAPFKHAWGVQIVEHANVSAWRSRRA